MEEKKNFEQKELKKLMESGRETVLILTNGFHLRCKITGFDDRVILIYDVKAEKNEMVYRHAVSTIFL